MSDQTHVRAGAAVEGGGAAARPAVSRRGKGFLAVAGTLAVAGLGHVMAGRWRRGLGWFVVVQALFVAGLAAFVEPRWVPALVVVLPLGVALHLWMLVDAYLSGRRSGRRMLGRPWLRYVAGLGIMVAGVLASPTEWLTLALREGWVEAFMMPSESMAPTLARGDRFLVHKRVRFGRWDVVAFQVPGEVERMVWAKRVVGLPGETVEIRDGVVHIDGRAVGMPAGVGPYRDTPGIAMRGVVGRPMVLGAGEYFVVGDDSAISGDSRNMPGAAPGHQAGAVPRGNIVGKATWRYWPVGRWGRVR